MKTEVIWNWEEAFDKFGFGDGDGLNLTDEVVCVLEGMGYVCEVDVWGIHNRMIMDVHKHMLEGPSIMTHKDGREVKVGYDDPREWLPKAIIKKLDSVFPHDE